MKFLLRAILRLAVTTIIVWALATYIDRYFFVTGGWFAYAVIAVLITIMNIVVEPVLRLIFSPLKLLANILAIILVNAVFLWLTVKIIEGIGSSAVTLQIDGGIGGWIVAAVALGIAKWIIRSIIR